MNVPKLRFKEFNDEWLTFPLSKIVKFSKGNLLSKADLDDEGLYPCILYGQLYTKYSEVIRNISSKTNRNDKNLILSKYGDILIPSSGETPIDISTSSCIMVENVILGGDINILSPVNCDGRFLSYLINNNKKKEIAKVAQGHSVVHLYNDNLKKINVNIPSLTEQTKIANTLELLDKKIELQTKKIEDLKLFKLCTAKIIFKDNFLLCKKQLKELCNIVKGKQINSEFLSETGEYYMLNGGINPSGFINEYNTNENTISISEGGNSCGYVNFNKSKFWAGGHCYTITPIDINNIYLYQILKHNENKIMDLRVGSGLPNIQKKDLENFSINVHRSNMQNKIATILSSIDKLIDLEEKKISNIEKLKKGLMQNMFV